MVRQQMRAEWEAGPWHPKEDKLLEVIMQEWTDSKPRGTEASIAQLEALGTSAPEAACDEVVQAQQERAVSSLLTPYASVSALPPRIRLMVVALTLSFWQVGHRIGRGLVSHHSGLDHEEGEGPPVAH
jgi:hypothetical protein